MSFGFLDVIFGEKGLEIDTYKPPKFIWSCHTHMVNTTCWPKWPRAPKLTFLSNFDVKKLPLQILFKAKILPFCLIYFDHDQSISRSTFCQDHVVNVILECKATMGYHELLEEDYHGHLKVKDVVEIKQGMLIPIELSNISEHNEIT